MLDAMRVKASRASATVLAPSSPRSAPASTTVTVRSVSVRISLTSVEIDFAAACDSSAS
jgi:hypothetical protein